MFLPMISQGKKHRRVIKDHLPHPNKITWIPWRLAEATNWVESP